MHTFQVKTTARHQMVEITTQVRAILNQNGIRQGVCVVYCPHTTAAITINENADPDVVHDVLLWYTRSVPKDHAGFRHGEGNSDSHIQATMIGPSQTLIVDQGDLVLGRWQGIFFCEFDGPRTRTVHVQIIAA
jgi:secondary thiamine-phosphate synthase enzyme